MAYDLDGTNDYMTSSFSISMPFTVACWAISDTDAINTMVALGDSTGENMFALGFQGTATGDPVAFRVRTTALTAFQNALTTTGFTTGTWHHIAGSAASATSRSVYIDGGSRGSSTLSRSVSPTELLVGGFRTSSTVGNYGNGKIAELGIWSIELSTQDIEALASGYSPRLVRPDKLEFYAPLIRTGADLIAANDFILSGPTVYEHPRRIG